MVYLQRLYSQATRYTLAATPERSENGVTKISICNVGARQWYRASTSLASSLIKMNG